MRQQHQAVQAAVLLELGAGDVGGRHALDIRVGCGEYAIRPTLSDLIALIKLVKLNILQDSLFVGF